MLAQLGRQSLLGTARWSAPLATQLPAFKASPASSILATTRLPAYKNAFGAQRAFFLAPTFARRAANPQSGAPASDNVKHMVQNIKEEAKSVGSSIESSVAGARKGEKSDGETSEIVSDAKTIVAEMTQRMPKPALLWGASGIIPYVTTAGASIYLARQAQLVADGFDSSIDFETASALLLHAENIQITFGAVLLSFLGAIHWGFEFSRFGGAIGNRRYALGLIPVACAWPTLMLEPQIALVAQWAAFVLTWFIDLRATNEGWAPKWYSSYRFMLTLAVGVSILATLAGTNYYNADKSRSSSTGVGSRLMARAQASTDKSDELLKRRSEGRLGGVPQQKKVGGDVETEKQNETGEAYVKIRNPKREEEERKKKEEEEKKKKQEEAEKKKKEKEGGGDKDKDKKKDDGEKKKDDGGDKKDEGKKDDDGDDDE